MNSNFAILLAILSLLLLLRIKVPTSLRSNITFGDFVLHMIFGCGVSGACQPSA